MTEFDEALTRRDAAAIAAPANHQTVLDYGARGGHLAVSSYYVADMWSVLVAADPGGALPSTRQIRTLPFAWLLALTRVSVSGSLLPRVP